MLFQLAIGTVLMLATILFAGLSIWLVERVLVGYGHWLRRPPHPPKLVAVLIGAAVIAMLQIAFGVWLWALTYEFVGIFGDIQLSLAFTLEAYTTLGLGDVVLPPDWRLLGGMASANGLVTMGMLTAVLVDVVRQVRLIQAEALRETSAHRVP